MNEKTPASDFWMSDCAEDVQRGGMTLARQREVVEELQWARDRLKSLEQQLLSSAASRGTAGQLAEQAYRLMPELSRTDYRMRGVWIAAVASAVDRAVHEAIRAAGFIGDHPGLRAAVKAALVRMRPEFRDEHQQPEKKEANH